MNAVIYITELNDKNYKEFIKGPLVLVDIKAIWCNPCKQISPIIDDLSVEFVGKVSVGKLDADSNPDIITELQIRSIPTILLYKNGKIIERSVGMTTKKKLSDLINKHL